jgi:hypothetical protein
MADYTGNGARKLTSDERKTTKQLDQKKGEKL